MQDEETKDTQDLDCVPLGEYVVFSNQLVICLGAVQDIRGVSLLHQSNSLQNCHRTAKECKELSAYVDERLRVVNLSLQGRWT
jgi:hypothetical protein